MAQSLTGGFEMKTYTITVNGTAYDVTVEEGTGSAAPDRKSTRLNSSHRT